MRASRTDRTNPFAKMLATSARRSATIIVSGLRVVSTTGSRVRHASCAPPSWVPYAVGNDGARFNNQSACAHKDRFERCRVATSLVASAEQRQPPHNPGARRRETPRDFGPNRAKARGRRCFPVISAGSIQRLRTQSPDRQTLASPWPTNEKRHRGFSTAFIVNQRVGRVCNRPSNSGGRI